MNQQLANELKNMVEAEQAIRRQGLIPHELDRLHAERMKEIIAEFGWPDIPLVGKEVAEFAWLLVQHADHDVEFQKSCLDLMHEKAGEGLVEKKYIALLTDRILIQETGKQRFGTQLWLEDGEMAPKPLEDPDGLDERRIEYDLEPIDDYIARVKKRVAEQENLT